MAIQPCRECQRDVSDAAESCPHCGVTMPARQPSADWVPCPKCGSAKTKRYGPGALGVGSFLTGSCMLWIPIIGWIVAPFLFLAAIVLWISALFPWGRIAYNCQECKQWSMLPKPTNPA